MSLDFKIVDSAGDEVYSRNITHNLCEMAEVAGVYDVLWRPDENGFETAAHCIDTLRRGLDFLVCNRKLCEKYDPANGWGSYGGLVTFVTTVLMACCDNPDGKIEVSR